MHIAYCLLPIAYCLLPDTCCLLANAYGLWLSVYWFEYACCQLPWSIAYLRDSMHASQLRITGIDPKHTSCKIAMLIKGRPPRGLGGARTALGHRCPRGGARGKGREGRKGGWHRLLVVLYQATLTLPDFGARRSLPHTILQIPHKVGKYANGEEEGPTEARKGKGKTTERKRPASQNPSRRPPSPKQQKALFPSSRLVRTNGNICMYLLYDMFKHIYPCIHIHNIA